MESNTITDENRLLKSKETTHNVVVNPKCNEVDEQPNILKSFVIRGKS